MFNDVKIGIIFLISKFFNSYFYFFFTVEPRVPGNEVKRQPLLPFELMIFQVFRITGTFLPRQYNNPVLLTERQVLTCQKVLPKYWGQVMEEIQLKEGR